MLSLALALQTAAALEAPQSVAVSALPNSHVRVSVLLDGQPRTLTLSPVNLRTADYRAFVSGPDGTVEVEADAPATYRGHLLEEPDAVVAAVVRDGQVRAMIDYPDLRPDWVIEPAERDVALDQPLHLVRRVADLRSEGTHVCGSETHDHGDFRSLPGDTAAAGAGVPILEVALDADHPMFLEFNSIQGTRDYMEAILLFSSLIYEKEVDLQLMSPWSNVWYNPNHPKYPYDEPNCSGTQQDFNGCLADYWSQPSLPGFDVMHAFLGGQVPGPTFNNYVGLARVGGVCQPMTASSMPRWALSEYLDTSDAEQAVIMTHEIGHSLGLWHTNEGIMQPFVSDTSFFSATQVTWLGVRIAQLTNSGCLDDFGSATPPPTVSSVSPAAAQVHGEGPISIFGTNLDTVTQLILDGDDYGPGTIEYVSSTHIRIQLKDRPTESLGLKSLEVRGAGGSVTTSLTLVETAPIAMTTWTIDFFPVYEARLEAFSGAGDVFAFGYSLTPDILDFGTWNVLAGWNLIEAGTLDQIGFSGVTIFSPSSSMIGSPYWVQAIGFDPVNGRESTAAVKLCNGC